MPKDNVYNYVVNDYVLGKSGHIMNPIIPKSDPVLLNFL